MKRNLTVENVSVSFDGFIALDNLSLQVAPGELVCLIGPNGAGKTTLIDVLTAKTRAQSGSVTFGECADVLRMTEEQIVTLGIGRKFQKPSVFEKLSVLDNLELSLRTKSSFWRALWASLTHAEKTRMDEVLELIGLDGFRNTPAGTLSHGQKQWLEVGMLIIQDVDLLLLDEPVAGMTQSEMERTVNLVKTLSGERSVVVVEHDMAFVRSIAQRVIVMHEGRVLAEGDMDAIRDNARVREVYLGA